MNNNKQTLKLKDEDKIGTCLKCKKEIKIDIPYISEGKLFYKSEDHGCGEQYVQWISTLDPSIFKVEENDEQ